MYLIVDPESRDLIRQAPPGLISRCQELLGDQSSPEFLQSQIEVGTVVCKSITEARDDLVRLRAAVDAVTREHGLAMIAASTHPFAS